MPRILIADDQADVLAALSLLLKGERFQIESASSPEGVLRTIDTHEFDVVLIDLNYARDTTSGSEGLDLLTRIRAADPTLPVVVMTAWGSVDLAVEAMRRGARDFIQKPWDNARLLAVLRTQVELAEALRRGRRLEAENIALRDSVSERYPADRFRITRDEVGAESRRTYRSCRCERAYHRRERHRQGSDHASASLDLVASIEAVDLFERGRAR